MKYNSPQIPREIDATVDILMGSRRVVVLTGAGSSTPSGIPDFRSSDTGLWTRFDPADYASIDVFRISPEKFFTWIRPLVAGILSAHPNPSHIGLAKLEEAGYINTIITQNIDGLHQRAGSQNVLEVHGTLTTLTCIGCFNQLDSKDYIKPFIELAEIPLCPDCGKILKPDVILFGEQLPVHTWLKAQEVSKKCDLMIVAGSSLEVLPVAGLPLRALDHGARLIVINKSETYIDVRADVVIRGDVADVVPAIAQGVLDE